MASIIHKFKSPYAHQWHWPIQVGVVNGTKKLGRQLTMYPWAQKFVEIEILSRDSTSQSKNVDILLIAGATGRNPKRIAANYPTTKVQNISAACVIMIVPGFKLEKPIEHKTWKKLAGQSRSRGLFIVDPGTNLSGWFEGIVVELSHNKDIVFAVRQNSRSGYFLFDPRLETSSSITFAIRSMMDQLKEKMRSMRPARRLAEPDALATQLLANLEDEQFLHEYEGASRVLDATERIQTALEKPELVVSRPPAQKRAAKLKRAAPSIKRVMAAPTRSHTVANYPASSSQRSKSIAFHVEKSGKTASGKTRKLKKTALAEPDNTRSLQAEILNKSANQKTLTLWRNTEYRLRSIIGNDPSLDTADIAFPGNLVFEKSNKQREEIQLIFKYDPKRPAQMAKISLPRLGDSTQVIFNFRTNSSKNFQAELYAYHKNRLLQKAILTSKTWKRGTPEGKKTSPLQITIVYNAVKELSNLGKREPFGASFFYEPRNSPGKFQGVIDKKAIDLNLSGPLDKLVKNIQADIETVVSGNAGFNNLKSETSTELFRKLALRGSSLYKNHLGGKAVFKGPMQIISKNTGFVPIDFVYDLPAPLDEAAICKKAEDALRAGKCLNCFNKEISPAKYICPFGFWTISRVIERHSCEFKQSEFASYQVVSASDFRQKKHLQILNKTIHACTARVDKVVQGTKKKVQSAVKENSSQFHVAETWKDWRSHFAGKNVPDSLILLVHTETDDQDFTKIEIGNRSMLRQEHLDQNIIGNSPPFIIMIGCETTNIEKSGFDISNQLMNCGAAIVVSNFTKIKGSHAGPIVIRLVQLLKDNRKVNSFGVILQRLRQKLLAEGYLVSLALMAHGDADWKIKCT